MIRFRSLSLSLAACLLTAGLWSCAGSSGGKTSAFRGPRPARDPLNPTLAVVAGKPITRHDVDSVLATAPAAIREDYLQDPEQYQLLVERIAQQQMLYLAAQRAGIESDSGYLAEVANQRRSILMKHYYQKTVAALPRIPDTEVRKYYDDHPTEFQMPGRVRVRHIQVKTQARAREVMRALKRGGWEKVCARYSEDKLTAKNGGTLGFVTSDGDNVPGIGKAPSIVAAAFTLKEGETSAPLKSDRGWHVIRADEKTDAGPQPYASVQQTIRGNLEGQRSEKFQEALLDSLKKVYGVVIYADSVRNAMKPILSPAQLFAKAQEAAAPQDRIELFKRVVDEFPNDKSAIQASFMIGFTYAEEMKDYPAARTAFQDFLRKYPKSDLVGSANWMLQNMEHSVPPPEVGQPDSLMFQSIPPKGAGTPQKP
jgi:peptidyl-prolyl cis-trans isomerase C